MIVQCVRSVGRFWHCCRIGVPWEFKVINFQMAHCTRVLSSYVYHMMQISGRVCRHQPLPNKPLPNIQVTWLFYDLGDDVDDVDASVRAVSEAWTDGRTDGGDWGTRGKPHPQLIFRVSKVRSGQPFHSATY